MRLPEHLLAQPRLRGVSHAWAFWAAAALAAALVAFAPAGLPRFAAVVYGAGLCALFGGSALYLLSDLASGVTGEVLHVDAGYHVVGMKQEDAPDIALG